MSIKSLAFSALKIAGMIALFVACSFAVKRTNIDYDRLSPVAIGLLIWGNFVAFTFAVLPCHTANWVIDQFTFDRWMSLLAVIGVVLILIRQFTMAS